MIKKEYVKDNKRVFKIINDKANKILSIKPIKKLVKKGIIYNEIISSYCIKYEKMI